MKYFRLRLSDEVSKERQGDLRELRDSWEKAERDPNEQLEDL